MPLAIKIKLDQNDHGVYFSGDVVSGIVEISFPKVKKVRGIVLKLIGYAETKWNERHSSSNASRRVGRFSGREDYVEFRAYLSGSNNANPTKMLPGIHTYNFAYSIPLVAPSSFEGNHGHIRYVAKVILDRPWKFDHTYTMGFTVIKSLDLNYGSPLLRIPSEVEVLKKFSCGFCCNKSLYLQASLPQTGFVPGQIIPIQTVISNASTVNISEIRFYLRQIIIYRADTPSPNSKEEYIDIVCHKSAHVEQKGYIKLEENIVIPAVPPTTLNHSKVIQITYEIKVEAVITGPHINPTVSCPITVGTIPLMDGSQQLLDFRASQIAVRTDADLGGAQGSTSLPIISPILNQEPTTPNIPPPSYEEAINMARVQVDEGEEHSIQRNDFVLRYPVYHFDQPTAPGEYEIAEDLYKIQIPS